MLSLGGTCVVQHLDGYRPRFATEVRSGGGPIYGHDFVSGCGITGLRRTDPVLTAAVLECYRKPPAPEGPGGLDAFGHVPEVDLPARTRGTPCSPSDAGTWNRAASARSSPAPTSPAPRATSASSSSPEPLHPGDEVRFAVDYDALVRAVTSPFVAVEFMHGDDARARTTDDDLPKEAS